MTDADPTEGGMDNKEEVTEVGPHEEAPKQEAPKQEAPTQEAPTQEAPTQETPKQEAPTQEAPTQETPTQETPTQEAPTQETPTQETPTQETPKQEEAMEDTSGSRESPKAAKVVVKEVVQRAAEEIKSDSEVESKETPSEPEVKADAAAAESNETVPKEKEAGYDQAHVDESKQDTTRVHVTPGNKVLYVEENGTTEKQIEDDEMENSLTASQKALLTSEERRKIDNKPVDDHVKPSTCLCC